MKMDWLIIGGGIHGVHIAARLLGDAGVDPCGLRIVDPGVRLLERWRTCAETTGMTHLRSPSVHHLDLNPWSLQRFAGKRKNRKAGLFRPPYDRPSLSLFNAHCDEVIAGFGLSELHVRARVTGLSISCDEVTVQLSDGETMTAEKIVLAIGASEQPEWPEWASREDAQVHHVFEPGFDAWPSGQESTLVVGGGISAAQLALRLAADGRAVQLLSRHGLRAHQFDSDPGWLGPKRMAYFRREHDIDRRRTMIVEARNRGSIPPDVVRALRRALRRDEVLWHEGEVEQLISQDGRRRVILSTGAVLDVDQILLATGFQSQRPGGKLIERLVKSASLPCARCGYPIVDGALRWHPRIYVSGPLAELELGPTARNIAGARCAGDRLVEIARADFRRAASL